MNKEEERKFNNPEDATPEYPYGNMIEPYDVMREQEEIERLEREEGEIDEIKKNEAEEEIMNKIMNKENIKKGDKVLITEGPADKKGKYGIVETMFINGAMVKLGEDHYTSVKFEHLKKV